MPSRTYSNILQTSSVSDFYMYRVGIVNRRSTTGWHTNNPYTSKVITVKHSGYGNKRFGYNAAEFNATAVPQNTVNAAISKLEQKLKGDSSQLMTAALEWNSSLRMVSSRSLQLWSAYRALRNWDLPRVARTLGMDPKFTTAKIERMRRLQRPTEAWLEYWMGWAPAVNDIYNAVNVIQSPYSRQHARAVVSWGDQSITKSGSTSSTLYTTKVVQSKCSYVLYANCSVSNPNLLMADQLGLINPIQTAWELVPFSFIVDWFTNVGQVLGNLNRFAGLTLSGTGEAQRRKFDISWSGAQVTEYIQPGNQKVWSYFSTKGSGTTLLRTPKNLPYAKLTLELPKLSLTRAATSVSLLTEIFLLKDKR